MHGIIVAGSTGGYYAQTMQERVEMMGRAAKLIDGRLPLIVGTGAIRTEEPGCPGVVAEARVLGEPPLAPSWRKLAPVGSACRRAPFLAGFEGALAGSAS